MLGDDFDEIFIETGMFHTDLHQDRDVIAELVVIGDNGIGLDQPAFFQLADSLDHSRD